MLFVIRQSYRRDDAHDDQHQQQLDQAEAKYRFARGASRRAAPSRMKKN
jgi:hypothetical protein